MNSQIINSFRARSLVVELQIGVSFLKMAGMNIRASAQTTDLDFVHAISKGHAQAESELVQKYQRKLVAFCCARSDANRGLDFAQQVWLKILPKLRSGKYDGKNMMALLCQTARNLVIDQSRRASEKSHSLDNNPIEPASTNSRCPLEQILEAEEMTAFTDCKQSLLDKEVAVLDGNENSPELESVSKPRIYKLRHFAIRKLRDCIRKKLERGA